MPVGSGKSKQVVRKCRITKSAVRRGFVNKELTVHVKIKSLVKTLAADVASELQRVLSHNLADTVRPLERISYLRQFAFTVIADGESAAHLYERESFELRS